jgi:hypothetical protein
MFFVGLVVGFIVGWVLCNNVLNRKRFELYAKLSEKYADEFGNEPTWLQLLNRIW